MTAWEAPFLFGLSFASVWFVDFEFIALDGALPIPVCMVARELGTGRLVRLWLEGKPPPPVPFDTAPQSLMVAFMAAAELSCMDRLGWRPFTRILDLYIEFRRRVNGLVLPGGPGKRSLLGALSYHHLARITSEAKDYGRRLVMSGPPWSEAEKTEILDYCQTDVDALPPLLERMLPEIRSTKKGFAQALYRGRYMSAVSRMEATGTPIDTVSLGRLRDRWSWVRSRLIAEVDRTYGYDVFDGDVFKKGKFAGYVANRGIRWPTTPTGLLKTDRVTFRDMSRRFTELEPLAQLLGSLGELRAEQLTVGPDGRNRSSLFPFGTITGRNAPSSTQFVFGLPAWLRSLVKPPEGQALACIDYSAQEVAIAAALSQDEALLAAVATSDPYLTFAAWANLAPLGATKATHGAARTACKTAVLGLQYGMREHTLALRLGTTVDEARLLLRATTKRFPRLKQWADDSVGQAFMAGRLRTVLGWEAIITPATRVTTVMNFPCQSHGAEVLRLASCLLTEAGVSTCAPVHDAVWVEAPVDAIDQEVDRARSLMTKAAVDVLGIEIATEATVLRWPERYSDPRGAAMWTRVMGLVGPPTNAREHKTAGPSPSAVSGLSPSLC